ncbi:MAG TPA: type II secretion system protein [Lacipirellulaceae bacterium]|nr:type II secretion system protein [Lacipirellulaceae bacterium]
MSRVHFAASRRCAFTLIELVVVIMILGILAAVAAPKLFNTSSTATENGVRQTLKIVRDAVQMYASQNGGAFPPCTSTGADFKTALEPFIRGAFPISPVGAKNSDVTPSTGATTTADATPTTGWKFNTQTGDFICNTAEIAPAANVAYETF